VKIVALAVGAVLPLCPVGCQILANLDSPLPIPDATSPDEASAGDDQDGTSLTRDADSAATKADAVHDGGEGSVDGDGAVKEGSTEGGSDGAKEGEAATADGPPGKDAAETGPSEAGPKETGPRETGPVESGMDAKDDSPPDVTEEPPFMCPGQAGPTMVNVGSFCIDSTEVTNSQYAAFLNAGPSLGLQPAVCSFNTDYTPGSNWPYPSGQDDYPVTFVDWCDAYAFCAWAGKRLCGDIHGGSLDPGSFGDPTADERYYACSNGGTQDLPYGGTYTAGACNLDQAGPAPVGSLAGCEGGFAGVFDLVGNVEEWLDSCTGTAGAGDTCIDGTASFAVPGTSGEATVTCLFPDSDTRNLTDPNVGFRCCAP
jgi:formylglycine-generating enzyme required for sulfatase activity